MYVHKLYGFCAYIPIHVCMYEHCYVYVHTYVVLKSKKYNLKLCKSNKLHTYFTDFICIHSTVVTYSLDKFIVICM